MPKLIDTHTHIQFAAYDNDWKEVIDRSLAQNIWLVNVGTQKDTSAKAVEIAEEYPEGVYATIGIHPIHTEKSHHDSQELGLPAEASAKEGGNGFTSRGEQFSAEGGSASGECGLDYYRLGENTKGAQEKAFLEQIQLASELKKPLMIHCRNAYSDLIQILDTRYKILTFPAGIIHFFSGTKKDAQQLLHLGFYFSFGGVITFVRDYDEVIKSVGLNKIVLETDAPYVTPVPHRGKRNEPAYVSYVAEKLAEILDKPVEEVAEATTNNATSVFGLRG